MNVYTWDSNLVVTALDSWQRDHRFKTLGKLSTRAFSTKQYNLAMANGNDVL